MTDKRISFHSDMQVKSLQILVATTVGHVSRNSVPVSLRHVTEQSSAEKLILNNLQSFGWTDLLSPSVILSDSLWHVVLSSAQRVGVCNTSGSGTDLPGRSCDVAETHGPLPQNTSLFMGFAFMLTVSSECDRLTNKLSSDEEDEGEGESENDKMRIIIQTKPSPVIVDW